MNKKINLVLSATVAAVLLSACNGSKKQPDTLVPFAGVAHSIAPNNVASYVQEHLTRYQAMKLELEGLPYRLSMMKLDTDNNEIYVYLDNQDASVDKLDHHDGYAMIGFDFETFQPLNKLSLCLGNIKSIEDKVDACYRSAQISMDTIVEDTQYSGTVKKNGSDGVYSINLEINEALITHGSLEISQDDSNSATLSGD